MLPKGRREGPIGFPLNYVRNSTHLVRHFLVAGSLEVEVAEDGHRDVGVLVRELFFVLRFQYHWVDWVGPVGELAIDFQR